MRHIKELIHNRQLLFALVVAALFMFTRTANGQAERRHIREGNRLYQKEQFDESELSYRRALERDEDSPRARFNLGNSLYKQERFDEALRYYSDLADEIDDHLNLSKVYHNIGNSLLNSGQIEKSIEAYKEALRNNPDDQETRYNLAYARHLLDEMDQSPQESDDSSEGDDRQEGDQDRQEDDQQQQEQDQQDDDRQQQGDDQQEESPQPRPDQISPEDAMRMLEAAEREEQRVQEKLMEQKAGEKQPGSGRNW